MCNRYSYTHGYICEECFAELVSLGVGTDIEDFLESTKKEGSPPDIAYLYFSEEFPERL